MLVPFIMIGLVVISGIVIWLDDADIHTNTHD